MSIAGIDLSLTGTGIAILDEKTGKILHLEKMSSEKMQTKAHRGQTRLRLIDVNNEVKEESFIPSSNLLDMNRISFFHKRIIFLLEKFNVTNVAIEGYSYNSQGRSIISLGELGGVIRYSLFDKGIKYTQCPPHNVKTYITGFAWASKDMIQQSIKEKYGIFIEDDNIGDAFVMANMLFDFKENLHTYCEEGGVDKLKEIKAEEYRKKFIDSPEIFFRKNLEIGKINPEDIDSVLKIMKIKEISENFKIDLKYLEKINIKKINENFKLKKPKK